MFRWIVLSLLLLTGCASTEVNAEKAQRSAQIHTELASVYYDRAQMGPALDEVNNALKYKPDYAPAYNMRALIHMKLHEDKQADDDFQHSLSLDHTDSDAQSNYGWFLCQHDREKESITHFVEALKNPLYQNPQQAYLNAAVCSQKMGDNNAAADFYQSALRVRPSLPEALLGMAQLSFQKEDYAAAKQYFSDYEINNDKLSAADLWLVVRIERELGDRDALASYSMKLRNLYPDSKETQLMDGYQAK